MDTGGLLPGSDEGFAPAIAQQVEAAIAEADLILLLVDARAGVAPADEQIAERLRRARKPVLLVANKIDDPALLPLAAPFYRLGLGDPLPVSAEHGLGTGDLLDAIVARLPDDGAHDTTDDRIRVAVVGRPNVGKSSLINRLLGDERVIVSDVPGTTRDAVDVPWDSPAGRFVFIDTAGMRRRARVSAGVEYFSVVRARRALQRADVAAVVFDVAEAVTDQDKRIAGLAADAGRALVLVLNKWDLLTAESPRDAVLAAFRSALPRLAFAPLLPVSARTGRGVERLPSLLRAVYEAYQTRIPTARLNRVIGEAVDRHHPPSIKGRRLRIHYATQVGSGPPTFALFVNDPQLMTPSYTRYLENRLRETFPLEGTPVRWQVRRA